LPSVIALAEKTPPHRDSGDFRFKNAFDRKILEFAKVQQQHSFGKYQRCAQTCI